MTNPHLMAVVVAALAAGHAAADPVTRVREYRLDIRCSPSAGSLEGRAEVTFHTAPAKGAELHFYLHGELQVERIEVAGQPVEFRQEQVYYSFDYSLIATKVTALSPDALATAPLSITYGGVFSPSRARSPSDYMRIDADGVLLRAYGYSLWFPVFLEAAQDGYEVAFPEVVIRTPPDFVPVFVGTRTAERVEGGERVSRWRADQVDLSAAQLTARRFRTLADDDQHVAYYTDEPGADVAAAAVLATAARLDAAFRARYRARGPAGPFHLMLMPPYGDISSGNVAGLTSGIFFALEKDPNALRGLAHELVHPFVQVPVERSDPLFALAVEGFPSYFHLPVMADLGYAEYVDRFLRWTETRYLEARRTGKDRRGSALPPEKPLVAIAPDEVGLYKDTFVLADRALLFLDYLRRRMGAAAFAAFSRELTNLERCSLDAFRRLVVSHLPGSAEDVRLWVDTTEFPERFHLAAPR